MITRSYFTTRPSNALTYSGECFVKLTSTAEEEGRVLMESHLEFQLSPLPIYYDSRVLILPFIKEDPGLRFSPTHFELHCSALRRIHERKESLQFRRCSVPDYVHYCLGTPHSPEVSNFALLVKTLQPEIVARSAFLHGDATLSNSMITSGETIQLIDLSVRVSPSSPYLDWAKLLFSVAGFDLYSEAFCRSVLDRVLPSHGRETAFYLASHVLRVHRKQPLSDSLLSNLSMLCSYLLQEDSYDQE